jgi:hypothetical protein
MEIMIVNQVPINNITEDTEIVFVNATTIKIQGIYYVLSGEFKVPDGSMFYDFTTVQRLSNGYIRSITRGGTNYSVSILRRYTKNNAAWRDLGFVDVSAEYTNDPIVNPIEIKGE